jgi:hypothetical protein
LNNILYFIVEKHLCQFCSSSFKGTEGWDTLWKVQLLSFVHLFNVLTTARDKCICVDCQWCRVCQIAIVSAYINVDTIYVQRISICACKYILVFGSSNSESRRRCWVSSLTTWYSTVPTAKSRNGISNKPLPLPCRLYLLHTNNHNT